MSSAFETLLGQAMQLSEDERNEFAVRLLRSLDPDAGDDLGVEAWEAAWSAEFDRRVHEIRSGSVELIEGDDVLAELREIAERP